MGTKANPCAHDCYAKALPDEPMFVLLARDLDAPRVVEEWARLRKIDVDTGLRPKEDAVLVNEAYECARAIAADWRKKNDGKWRI